jgi:small subunit ribosomal protein S6
MNKYELLVILSAQADDAANDALVEKVQSIIESKGIKVESVDKWGVKKFAYKINYKDEGVYVLFNVEADGACLAETQKLLNITDNVVRAMFSKK